MKKTVTANLNGRVFTMDEDAFQLLENYLNNLRIYFRKEEGASEIIADFESRIEELLSNKLRQGVEVINIKDIEEVISLMGNPSDFDADGETTGEEYKNPNNSFNETKKKFFRNPDDKMLGGVCSGLAAYFGWDVKWIRVLFILFLFVSTGWFAILYFGLWLIIPLANTAEEKLQMRGKPVTVENIGKTVSKGVEEIKREANGGCLNGLAEVFVGILKIFLTGIGLIVGGCLLFVVIIVLIVLFATLFGIGDGFISGWAWDWMRTSHGASILTIVSLSLVILIPTVSIIYSIIARIANFKSLHASVKWIVFILWFVALVLFIASGVRLGSNWTKSYFIEGNNIPAERIMTFDNVSAVSLDGRLNANLQIEQVDSEETTLDIYADSNIMEEIEAYTSKDGKLVLSTKDKHWIKSNPRTQFILKTPRLEEVKLRGDGNLQLRGRFIADKLLLKIEGSGDIKADSLQVRKLKMKVEGTGDVLLAGMANQAHLGIDGSGDIRALDLRSDSVYVRINGAGDVRCYPVVLLDAHINGAGDIKYKEEPQNKKTGIVGAGSIGKQ